MKETNVSYELAVALKEVGFDWDCEYLYLDIQALAKTQYYDSYYNNKNDDEVYSLNKDSVISCAAPTLALAQKWFREVHKIHIDVQIEMVILDTYLYTVTVYIRDKTQEFGVKRNILITGQISYEEALEKGLIHACKLIKQ